MRCMSLSNNAFSFFKEISFHEAVKNTQINRRNKINLSKFEPAGRKQQSNNVKLVCSLKVTEMKKVTKIGSVL